jgi:hypothetical protein
VTFYPQLSPRLNKKFSELSWSRGPIEIGVTGEGTYEVLYSSDWLTLIDVNRRLEAYQLIDDEWVDQSQSLLLPPIFDTQLPAGVRRLTHAFDQAARIICAYEDGSGTIQVTRWDQAENQYIQNVSFSGSDPCLLMQALVDYRIPGSDIWLFYRRDDTVYWRRQGDNYGIENELFSDSDIGVLDRAQALIYRYQLLVSDTAGEPLNNVLRSSLFPIPLSERFLGGGSAPSGGEYVKEVEVLEFDLENLEGSGTAPTGGEYLESVLDLDLGNEDLAASGSAPAGAAYESVVIIREPQMELLDGEATAPSGGVYQLVVIVVEPSREDLVGAGSAPTGGVYEAV